MAKSVSASLKSISASKSSLKFHTRHPNKDRYCGLLIAARAEVVVFQVDNDLRLDGVIAMPVRRIRRVEKQSPIMLQLLKENGEWKRRVRLPWLKSVKNVAQMLKECRKRKLWPVVETLARGDSALFIGPITRVGEKDFEIFVYDAKGKWENNYRLKYSEVFKVEIFDNYSTTFSRHMKKRLPAVFKN